MPTLTSAIVLAAPSMLSNRLKVFTTPTTQTIVSARSTPPPSPRSQPSPACQRPHATTASNATRSPGEDVVPVVDVPTTQSTAMPPTSGSVRPQSAMDTT